MLTVHVLVLDIPFAELVDLQVQVPSDKAFAGIAGVVYAKPDQVVVIPGMAAAVERV